MTADDGEIPWGVRATLDSGSVADRLRHGRQGGAKGLSQSGGSDAYSRERALWVPGQINEPLRPRLAAVRIRTSRTAELIDWYGTVLGARIASRSRGGAVLELERGGRRLELEDVSDGSDAASGPMSFAVEFDWLDELHETYLRLKSLAIVPERADRRGAAIELLYRDPDDNHVGLRHAHDLDASELFDLRAQVVDLDALAELRG
jgi:glyoxalase/bleomycin resistance protein/dioxygenase superfamily protein